MDKWKEFKEKVKAKRQNRTAQRDTCAPRKLRGSELTVQRMSAEVGRGQKYNKTGPREFVPFDKNIDISLENMKTACEKHFEEDENLMCDVLAGERGPSCQTLEQVPDLKLIYVRFIPRPRPTASSGSGRLLGKRSYSGDCAGIDSGHGESSSLSEAVPVHTTSRKQKTDNSELPAVVLPRSLSVSEMLKLGKLVNHNPVSTISVYSFDIETFSWSTKISDIDFFQESVPCGSGGFRDAYKATTSSKNPLFKDKTWVIKRYRAEAKRGIEEMGQTVQQHTKKVVQMHLLARNFALKLQEKVERDHLTAQFGETLAYNNIFYGRTDGNEDVTVEEYVDGAFDKYINNTGLVCPCEAKEIVQKAESLCHFSYEKSEKKLLLLDIQGSGYKCYDPEIASSELQDGNEMLYCAGNLFRICN